MIAEAGLAALWLAAAMAALQLLLAANVVYSGREEMVRAIRPVAIAQGFLVGLAMLCLILVFARSDMSVLLVAENSQSREQLVNVMPFEAAPPGAFIPSPVKVPVGGAVMFVMDVEQFHRF